MKIEVIVDKLTLTEQDQDLIRKILKAANITEYWITNTRYYKIAPYVKGNFYVIFSSSSWIQVSDLTTNYIKFPDLNSLHDKPGNEKSRELATELIDVLISKTSALSLKEVDMKSLPNVSLEKLLALVDKQEGITLVNNQNETIRICFNSDDDTVADKRIMYSELLAIKLAMELFKDIKEIKWNK